MTIHRPCAFTTNGFEPFSLYSGAVNIARKLKSSTPLTGQDDILIRDEIELLLRLIPDQCS